MPNTVSLFQRLLEDPSVNSKEHVLDTASYHVENVRQKFEEKYDGVLKEIESDWGLPIFNSSLEEHEGKKSVAPNWSNGSARDGGVAKALRLAYWKRESAINYVVLRTEIDEEKERPLYYEIVLGARRRGSDTVQFSKMRHKPTGIWATIRSWFAMT
ncbi:MAG TPA: hypothetical protein V6D17_08265 [Candidatus Obscuribacterales bacterium]